MISQTTKIVKFAVQILIYLGDSLFGLWGFFAKPPHTPKNLNGFSCVAVEFEQTPLNFAQIEH